MIRLPIRGDEGVPWHPLPNVPQELSVQSIEQTGEELTIRLVAENGRGLALISQSCLALQTIQVESAEGLSTAFEQEVLPYGRFWEVVSSGWSSSWGLVDQAPLHHLVVTDDLVLEILSRDALHVSWDDNFFGDAA